MAELAAAFASPDRARHLKLLLAAQFHEIEDLFSGGEDGSVLVHGRNEVAIRVLRREMRGGHDRLCIFYGAGHMADLEERLIRDLGFEKTDDSWLVAWDMEGE